MKIIPVMGLKSVRYGQGSQILLRNALRKGRPVPFKPRAFRLPVKYPARIEVAA